MGQVTRTRDRAQPDRRSTAAPSSGSAVLGTGAARWVILVAVLGYLLLPMVSMVEFATRGPRGTRTIEPFVAIFGDANLFGAVLVSLELAALTVLGMVVLLVPTMVWAQLRAPRLRRVIEFLCPLPLAIPAVVLVVGIAPIYRFLLVNVSSSTLILVFVDIILVLPFAYRAIDGGLRARRRRHAFRRGSQPRRELAARDA